MRKFPKKELKRHTRPPRLFFPSSFLLLWFLSSLSPFFCAWFFSPNLFFFSGVCVCVCVCVYVMFGCLLSFVRSFDGQNATKMAIRDDTSDPSAAVEAITAVMATMSGLPRPSDQIGTHISIPPRYPNIPIQLFFLTPPRSLLFTSKKYILVGPHSTHGGMMLGFVCTSSVLALLLLLLLCHQHNVSWS
jgi:hypothetical protein